MSKALAYKHQIGYLPSPSTSSSGGSNMFSCRKQHQPSLPSSERTTVSPSASLLSLSRANSAHTEAASAEAANAARSAPGTGTDECSPGSDHLQEQAMLPALPAGGVPKFGTAQTESTSENNTLLQSVPDRQSGVDSSCNGSGNNSTTRIDRLGSAVSSGTIPQALHLPQAQSVKPSGEAVLEPQLLQSAKLSRTQPQSQHQPSHPSVLQPALHPIVLAPPATAEPVLLAVTKRLPPAMQRQRWCLADFVVQKRLYDGYASTISKVRPVQV